MRRGFSNRNKRSGIFIPYGRNIKAKEVRCISETNENIGVIPLNEAIKLAEERGLELVQISKKSKDPIPTCKILDFGKYKYEMSKKKKEADKKKRENEIKVKEIKFKPGTDINDLSVKSNKVNKFIGEGNHVKVCIVFRGREIAYRNNGFAIMKSFTDLLQDFGFVKEPSFQGNTLYCIVKRVKK